MKILKFRDPLRASTTTRDNRSPRAALFEYFWYQINPTHPRSAVHQKVIQGLIVSVAIRQKLTNSIIHHLSNLLSKVCRSLLAHLPVPQFPKSLIYICISIYNHHPRALICLFDYDVAVVSPTVLVDSRNTYYIESSNGDAEQAQRTGLNLQTPKKVHS